MFKKYNSIENTYRSELIERLYREKLTDQNFVVQEKVHGSNLSYMTSDGVHFTSAKRSGMIPEGESFNNYEVVLERIESKLCAIWNELKKVKKDLIQMSVFGELIGGNYPHKDVPRVKGAVKIQKGIYYGPDNYFFAFDILINRQDYLPVSEANALFDKYDLLYAKTLFSGSLEECLDFPNDNESIVHLELGLPALTPNISEGVVIRPEKPVYLSNGSRVILKNKNEKWAEKIKSDKKLKAQEPIPEKIVALQAEILHYVTKNRLNNVLSKVGTVSVKDFGKLMGLFNKDVVEDFLKDHAEVIADLDKKELKLVTKSAGEASKKLIRSYFNIGG